MAKGIDYHRTPRQRQKRRKVARWRRLHKALDTPRLLAKERPGAAAQAALLPRFKVDPRKLLTASAKLEEAIHGSVVLPWDAGYDKARLAFNPAYQAYPLAIVYCEDINDVSVALSFAGCFKMPVVCRAGGHSFAGYSVLDGRIVVDLSRMSHVRVDAARRRVVVGAGATLYKLNLALNGYRLHVPGGGCGGVGVGGHVQTGGYGFTAREFGMNCDSVVEFLVVLPNGRPVRANARQNRDLFWALQGGTGNNFGVLVEVTYRTHDLWKVWGFGLRWPAGQAAAVLDALQRGYTSKAPSNKLGWEAILQRTRGPALFLRGMYSGRREAALKMLAPLLRIGKPRWQNDEYGSYLEMNEKLLSSPVTLPAPPQDAQGVFARSGYMDRPAGVSGWGEVVDFFRAAPQKNNTISFEAYGGAINARPVGVNAFIHRRADLDLYAFSFWTEPAGKDPARRWVGSTMTRKLQKYLSGYSFQGYPLRAQKDYRQAYWGEYLPCLQQIKQKYNPTSMMNFGQSIESVVSPEDDVCSGIVSDQPIVYEPFYPTVPDWSG